MHFPSNSASLVCADKDTLEQIVEWSSVILIEDTKTLMWRHCNAGFVQTDVFSALFNCDFQITMLSFWQLPV